MPDKGVAPHYRLAILTAATVFTTGCDAPRTPGGRSPVQPAPTFKVTYTPRHTSGNLAYTTGVLTSGVCHLQCTHRVSVPVPSGYEQAETILTGWSAENLGGPTRLQRLTIGVTPLAYDAVAGNLEWQADVDVRADAGAGDEYHFTVYFTIVLAKSQGARLIPLRGGCSAPTGGSCSQRKTQASFVAPGWGMPALGVRGITLEAGAGNPPGGISLSRIAMHTSRTRLTGNDLGLDLDCAMHDATPVEPMSCDMDLLAIASAPGETFETHFSSGHYAVQFFNSSSVREHPPGLPVDGAFGGMNDFVLTFGTTTESKTWAWAADYNDILLCPDKINFCYYRLGFLGDSASAATNLLKFRLEVAGFGIWTRP
jgi:hypothetical protein